MYCCTIVLDNPERKGPLGIRKHKWEDSIKDVRYVGCKRVHLTKVGTSGGLMCRRLLRICYFDVCTMHLIIEFIIQTNKCTTHVYIYILYINNILYFLCSWDRAS